jgi:hypothetical protein
MIEIKTSSINIVLHSKTSNINKLIFIELDFPSPHKLNYSPALVPLLKQLSTLKNTDKSSKLANFRLNQYAYFQKTLTVLNL